LLKSEFLGPIEIKPPECDVPHNQISTIFGKEKDDIPVEHPGKIVRTVLLALIFIVSRRSKEAKLNSELWSNGARCTEPPHVNREGRSLCPQVQWWVGKNKGNLVAP
jgi:hypothetical protein